MNSEKTKKSAPSEFQSLVSAELLKRKERNPSYSLRSFARQLRMSPAHLSNLLSGKRKLTLKQASKISDQLGLSPFEREQLLFGSDTNLSLSRNSIQARILENDQFALISDWYHFALLSLGETNENFADPKKISKKLGISTTEATGAMQRLERMGIIRIESGRFRQVGNTLDTARDIPSSAVRKFHQQMCERAKESLENVSVAEREFNSITLAIDATQIRRAKKMMEEFKQKLAAELERGKRSKVYHLTLQLFPLSKDD
jgi:plasmid maintenance system antidote protein VapI